MPTLAYSCTLNNYTPDDVATLKNGHRYVSYLIAGHEVAATGTPHLQVYFQLEKQVRFSTIKKWGKPWDEFHFEQSRGSDEDNYRYCTKDGSFWEIGERRTMAGKGCRTDLMELKHDIYNGMEYDTICDVHFGAAIQFHRFIKELVQAQKKKTELLSLLKEYDNVVWKPWQKDLLTSLDQEPDNRTIQWIWEPTGNVGKSYLTTYLLATGKAALLSAGRKADMAYILAKDPKPIVIFDLPRTAEEHMDGLYNLAEDLKNNRLISTKYDSETLVFSKKHVVIFANFEPDMTKWSIDRYKITRL